THNSSTFAIRRQRAPPDRHSFPTRRSSDLKEDLNDVIIGAEGGLRAVFERMCLVARSDVPVLILGETGTGKEVIARSIHTRSTRSEEHTSELQSRENLVCRLLLEKKKDRKK